MKKTKIAACFWYGRVYPKIIDYTCLIAVIISIAGIPYLTYSAMIFQEYILFILVAMLLFGLPIFLWVFIVLKKMRKRIGIALIDAVELQASAYRTNGAGKKGMFLLEKEARLTVEFVYNEEKMKITSETPSYARILLGYKAFCQYENKKIRILYSPSQKHVLILKEQDRS